MAEAAGRLRRLALVDRPGQPRRAAPRRPAAQHASLQRNAEQRDAGRTTTRLLESLIRLAQAHAKLVNRATVEVQDAVYAILVTECSAATSKILGPINALHSTFPLHPEAEYQELRRNMLEKLGLDDECRPKHGGGAQGYAATFGPSGGVSRALQGGSRNGDIRFLVIGLLRYTHNTHSRGTIHMRRDTAHAAQLDFRGELHGGGTSWRMRQAARSPTVVVSPSSADERRGRNSPGTEKAPLEARGGGARSRVRLARRSAGRAASELTAAAPLARRPLGGQSRAASAPAWRTPASPCSRAAPSAGVQEPAAQVGAGARSARTRGESGGARMWLRSSASRPARRRRARETRQRDSGAVGAAVRVAIRICGFRRLLRLPESFRALAGNGDLLPVDGSGRESGCGGVGSNCGGGAAPHPART